jgi:tetraacyldisaccharide 4'-kinase
MNSGDDMMSFRTKGAAYFNYLMGEHRKSPADKLVLSLLGMFSRLYRWGVLRKYYSFRNHPEKRTQVNAVVISLGNITVGGTGKTPMACFLARRLQQRGYRVALLNRGYRSKAENDTAVMSDGTTVFLTAADGGDEAYLMARSLPGVPVIVGRQRGLSAQRAVHDFQAQVILLDDGFQHWKLARNLDIVLIDAANPFGNGKVLPAGILREPMEQLARAGLCIITKADQRCRHDMELLYGTIRRYNQKAPIAEAVHRAKWCIPFTAWNSMKIQNKEKETLPVGTKVIAVSALGNPASFEHTVKAFGYDMVRVIRYDDHHPYQETDMDAMVYQAGQAGAVLVTTEKDAVKMPAAYIEKNAISLYVLGIEIEIIKGNEAVNTKLRQVLGG